VEPDFDDVILSLAERAVEVMTGQDLRQTLEALQATNLSLASSQGILAASISSLIERELARRGL
jgi:hypothetical protein